MKIKELALWPPTDWETNDHKRLPPESALHCTLKDVATRDDLRRDYVEFSIEYRGETYTTRLIVVPEDLRDRVERTVDFLKDRDQLTVIDLAEKDILP
jgi:hypothetical protein